MLPESEDGFVKTKVKPRDKFHLEFHIEEVGTHLEWQFRTEGHDISFGLFSDKAVDLVPLMRVESQKSIQEGRLRCETVGKYTIVFDNTHSYTRSKTLYHNVEVIDCSRSMDSLAINSE